MKGKEREALRKETEVETLGEAMEACPTHKGAQEGSNRLETNQAGAGANEHLALQGLSVAHWRTAGLRARGKGQVRSEGRLWRAKARGCRQAPSPCPHFLVLTTRTIFNKEG